MSQLGVTATPLTIGSVIAGRYVLKRLVGEGGMGQVFEAEHTALGRCFALKVLRLERWSDELVQRFQREARALGKITSARVAQVTDFGVEPGVGPFYVMELIDGETLEHRLEREGKLPPAEVVRIGIETCEALAEVHAAGIVHRDLKPSNIGLPRGGPVGIKLLDFGLAAAVDDSFLQRITRSQQILGSLPYMAPEQFHSARPSPAQDLYALGVVLFEAVTGRHPFRAPSTAALIHQILAAPVPSIESAGGGPAVPVALAHVITRLLEKDPAARPTSGHAVAAELRAVLAAPSPSVTPMRRPAPLPPTLATPPEMASVPVLGTPAPAATAPATPTAAASGPQPARAGSFAPMAALIVAGGLLAGVATAGAIVGILHVTGSGDAGDGAGIAAPIAPTPVALGTGPGAQHGTATVPSQVRADVPDAGRDANARASTRDSGQDRTSSPATSMSRVPDTSMTARNGPRTGAGVTPAMSPVITTMMNEQGAWTGEIIEDP